MYKQLKALDEFLAEEHEKTITRYNNLIGQEISKARDILGYWWVLTDQNITSEQATYYFENKSKGKLTLITQNNIVKKIL